MYEEIVAAARQSSETAVRESQERVEMAVSRSAAADRTATDATKAFGDRWVNRINAMRRRAAEAKKPPEHQFGHEDETQPQESAEPELTSLTEPSSAEPPPVGGPAEGVRETPGPREPDPNSAWFNTALNFEDDDRPTPAPPQPPRRQPQRRPQPTVDDDDDYSGQSWLQGG